MVGELGQAPYPALCLPGDPPAKPREIFPLPVISWHLCLGSLAPSRLHPWSSSSSSSPLFNLIRGQEVNPTTFNPKKRKENQTLSSLALCYSCTFIKMLIGVCGSISPPPSPSTRSTPF